MDFSSLMQQAADTANSLTLNNQEYQDQIQKGVDIEGAKEEEARNTADAASRIADIKLTDAARQEGLRQKVAIQIGSDPADAGWAIGEYAKRVKDADQRMVAASANIKAIDSTSFLDNPLGWLYGQTVINSHISEYNDAARDRESAENAATKLEAMTTDSFHTINSLSNTVSEAYINAAKVVEAHQYNVQAVDAMAQAVRLNLDGIKSASEADKNALQIAFEANSAKVQQQQLGIAYQHLTLATKEYDLKAAAAKEKTDEDGLILRNVQTGYFALTGKRMDPTKAKDVVILYKAKSPDIVAMFESGLQTNMVGKPIISASPFEASDLYVKGRVQNLPEAQKQVADQLVTWRRDWQQTPDAQAAIAGKDKVAAERSFREYVYKQAQSPTADIYKPMPLSQVVVNNPSIANLPVWKNVLAPAAGTGVDVNDPNTAMGLISGAMRAGKLSYVDAADYSTAIAAGLNLNNATRNFQTFGMLPQKSYSVPISIPGTFGKTSINLADPKSFATALNKMEAINAYYRMNGGNNPQLDTSNGGAQ